ncbi:MAG: multiheme c-type cytochrome [Planctomycetota bacterium]|nr:multiheme c-type cytochrome [Planctomycetota bacterium]
MGRFFLSAFFAAVVWIPSSVAQKPANANLDVQYVGTEACISCHKDQYETYLETRHSRSMEKVDPDKELTSKSFTHQLSGNDYEVLRRGDEVIHKEILRGADGTELASTEKPIVYTIGSGDHGKSYVYQDGKFFGQSPLSFYEETQRWAMSPGYDLAFHPGFGRKLTSECFFCHVGSIDQKLGNPNDFTVLELTIGCERCHGPGELHVARHEVAKQSSGDDNTIVNPVKLSRERSEAICQQCHLQAAGKALMSGKNEWDYRPGLPLTDYRIDYQYRLGDDTMRIVGHVEQLHMSKCYQQTESLTCITCHDPHHTPPPGDAEAFYRSICFSCHNDEDCGETHRKRIDLANNDCSQCHMPAQGTEVAHTAFHHHRIGIHGGTKSGTEPIVGLTSVLDVSRLSELDRRRCEALAKFQVAQEQSENPLFRDYGIESAKVLIDVKNKGRADADVNTILAMLALSQGQPAISKDLASEVVDTETKPSRPRIESLRLLGQLAYQRREFAKAVEYYREVTKYQAEPFDYFQLGVAEQNSGDSPRAVAALKMAVTLAPNYVDAHQLLSAILRLQGRALESARHADLAERHKQRLEKLQAMAP